MKLQNMVKQFTLLCLLFTACHQTQGAYFEGFDNVGNITNNNDPLKWAWLNKSQNPGTAGTIPSDGGWWQGTPLSPTGEATFFSQSGPANSYARADYGSAPLGNVFSNWFFTPTFDFVAGDTFSFYTRTITNSNYPDRLQIRQS
ncbi:MAG: choice-of-anchor J domain-containing protein, partial [bacterium]